MSVEDNEIHHRDTEDTEIAQRKEFITLCVLCALCVSVVNASFIFTQDHIELAPDEG
jgi:hypothetical protein